MQQRAALLSGEHPSLPAAELQALLRTHGAPVAQLHASVGVVDVAPGVDEALARLALGHEWGDLWGCVADDAEGIDAAAVIVGNRCNGQGRIAVAVTRRGAQKSPNHTQVARALGAAAKDAGHPIDLKTPERTLFAWLIDGQLWFGERLGVVDRTQYEARIAEERAHFAPVGLHPRKAAALLHLAAAAPGSRVYDPFCGTGGFLLEAALEGFDVWGSDIDPWMAQGSLQTLTDVMDEPLDANVFVCDIGDAPDRVELVDAIVTDLPYGRASGTQKEATRDLYKRALVAFVALLKPGCLAVIGCADPTLLVDTPGLERVGHHEEYVHKTLIRHFVIMKRAGSLDDSA